MRDVTLLIAMSLDGYIARKDGAIDWLHGESPDENDMASYDEFIKDIDTVVMGWNTYEQVTEELSPGNWAYGGMQSYILTHRELPAKEEITFIDTDVRELVKALKQEEGKGIWICGGAAVIAPLIRANMIDRFHISIIPVLLGGGIRLFEASETEISLKLVKNQSYNGITDVIYERR